MRVFDLVSDFKPQGDQPQAIKKLKDALKSGKRYNTLLGVTGSGKTFTMANVIAAANKPTLVISHNKTLAAQLYGEFRKFFPRNAVEYFVSYYDYYQPEAYIPQTDTYIEKDASINDNLDRLRLSATTSLLSRRDVIIVASVSCIYNLGSPADYKQMLLFLEEGQVIRRDEVLEKLVGIQYERNDIDFSRGKFRARGDVVDIFPAYAKTAVRLEFLKDKIEKITEFTPLGAISGKAAGENIHCRRDKIAVYPAKHFVVDRQKIEDAVVSIEKELSRRFKELANQNKFLEAQRLMQRTKYDIEMMRELGYCHGIENYSRHLSGRAAGSRPCCMIDYFSDNFLTIIDESHATIPQIRGMYEGDKARKDVLVKFGFRLPSCLDNRPLKFSEFESLVRETFYVSATPSDLEIKRSGKPVEQIIRPTGLTDPEVIIRSSEGQIDDLIKEIKLRLKAKERILVTTLTKRMAEDLTSYLKEMDLRVEYLHSEIGAIERVQILKNLRLHKFDCLVGINLLREGLDLPEVSLVAVLDADKEGFLRSQTSLIQIAGRAARNINGKVIMYADTITGSMERALKEMQRRRRAQIDFNKRHNITPRSIKKAVKEGIEAFQEAKEEVVRFSGQSIDDFEKQQVLAELEADMQLAARNLQFERAAELRNQIARLKGARSREVRSKK